MHNFWEFFLIIAVGGWVFDSMVNRRIDKRLRAAGLPTPAKPQPKPKPPGLSLRQSLTLVGAVFFLIGLMAVAGKIGLGVNRPWPTAQVSTDPKARRPFGPPIRRPE